MWTDWVDCDRQTVRKRYDRIAGLIPLFDRLFFLPADFRRSAVDRLELGPADSVLDVGCGTGANFAHLRRAVGPYGRIYGVDISPGMLLKARELRQASGWNNIELTECDAAEYTCPEPLDGVLFSLSYNTMPHHRSVLRRAWEQLRPGGRLVIMDARLPAGLGGRLLRPFSIWLMKRTMLGNPLIQPWDEVAVVAGDCEMSQRRFGSYYICRAIKAAGEESAEFLGARAANDESPDFPAHRIAAE